MNIWVTSDQHFGHSNILKACNRPFNDVEEMNEVLIENWNSRIKECDTVKILGDLFWNTKTAREILPALNGKKHLILGNHDKNWKRFWKDNDLYGIFELVELIHEFKHNDTKYVCCHYPMLSWNNKFNGSKHLYGHTHGNKVDHIDIKGAFHVGVDTNNYFPVNIEEIK